jgi:hypothetical protein
MPEEFLMAEGRWSLLTLSNDSDFLEVVDRYTPEDRERIVALGDIQKADEDRFLTAVFKIVCVLTIDLRQSKESDVPAEREQLKALREQLTALAQILKTTLEELADIQPSTLQAIAVQAKLEVALASGEKFEKPIEWADAEGQIVYETLGRPIEPAKSSAWLQSGIGRFLTQGGEPYVEDAITAIKSLEHWTCSALENSHGRIGRPPEVIVRRAVRRLRLEWTKFSSRPPSLKGRFAQFVEAVLRPAVRGYWPDQRKFHSAITDVNKEVKLRDKAKPASSRGRKLG